VTIPVIHEDLGAGGQGSGEMLLNYPGLRDLPDTV
jgi:hypothetical protein